MINTRPGANEYAAFYADYVRRANEADIVEALKAQRDATISFLRTVPEAQAGKLKGTTNWTIKQVVEHLCDAERVFSYRALRFARGDEKPLQSFEQDDYVANGVANQRTLASLIEEYSALRAATIAFAASLTDQMAKRTGVASGKRVSVRALLRITVGHDRRHLEIMQTLRREQSASAARA